MENNNEKKPFSWHLYTPNCVEGYRESNYEDCWIQVIISSLGDRVSIFEGLESVYPSIVDLFALSNDFRKTLFYEEQKDLNDEELTLHPSYNKPFLKFLVNKFVNLELCHPLEQIATVIRENGNKFVNTYTIPECCLNCLNTNSKNELTECKYPCDDDIYKELNIYISGYEIIHTDRFFKSNNIKNIKRIQEIIKEKVRCTGPICASIPITNEYLKYIKDMKDIEEVTVFELNGDVYNHVIVILGWGKENDIEFWWIRDSNSQKYLKIAFATAETIAKSYGGIEMDYIFLVTPNRLNKAIKKKYIKNGTLNFDTTAMTITIDTDSILDLIKENHYL